jgi:hypothetical protein
VVIDKDLVPVFSDSPLRDDIREYWNEILESYMSSGLAPPDIKTEIEIGLTREPQKFWAGLWEAVLYGRFSERGFEFRRDRVGAAGQDGPDLGLISGEYTVWIEAIVPSPTGIPKKWLEFRPNEAFSVPHEQILLRWTSASKDKLEQLDKRIKNGIVADGDAYVVAINACMLSRYNGEDFGISQFPYAVETVFPIGPLAVRYELGREDVGNEPKQVGPVENSHRFSIKNRNKADVSTANFLDPNYQRVSALIGSSSVPHPTEVHLTTAVHNPLATHPLGIGFLELEDEYYSEEIDDGEYELKWTESTYRGR